MLVLLLLPGMVAAAEDAPAPAAGTAPVEQTAAPEPAASAEPVTSPAPASTAAAKSPDTFTPSEEISEDLSVSFPVDI